ncbi:MAG: hypothetical protein K0R08_1004 [Solimicrobium sp.]|nr:hypothetical protein [Solimicrobium sp.]
MFNPRQEDSRRFFCETYQKTIARELLTPLESIASYWITQHPEYATDFANLEVALEKDYSVERGKTNPFLHLALHLAIAEQLSINQPVGISVAFTALAERLQSEHEAHHLLMECLAKMVWESQRNGTPFDSTAYIAAVHQKCRA